MVQKEAVLYLEWIHCYESSENSAFENGDDVYIEVYGDGVKLGRYPEGTVWHMKQDDEDRVDIEIRCTYLNELRIVMMEADSNAHDHLGEAYIRRGEPLDDNNCGTREFHSGDGNYEIGFRFITDPIPTVRILGIYCQQDSDGQDGGVVNAIADAAIAATEAAATVIGLSPRPSRELLSDAFAASAAVMTAKQTIGGWIKEWIEGDDDVYLKHIANNSTRGEDGAFFPPGQDTYPMHNEMEADFVELYGHYFRFPADEGDVTIEFREKDAGPLQDIIIGSLVIKSDQILEGKTDGIEGGSPPYNGEEDVNPIPGAMAVYDGPAVVEVANSYYGRQDGAGALYHICYSVGTEDWLLPATAEGQGDPKDQPKDWFRIKARHSGDYLTISNSGTDNGTPVVTFGDGKDNYLFKFETDDDGYSRIINKHSNKVLSVHAESQENGAVIEQWDQSASHDNTRFKVEYRPGGYYRMRAKHSGKYITVKNGYSGDWIAVIQDSDHGADYQEFSLEPAYMMKPGTDYRLQVHHSDKFMEIKDKSNENGAVTQQNIGNHGSEQVFTFRDVGSGYFEIPNMGSGKILNVSGESKEDGAIIQQFDDWNTNNARFKCAHVGGGKYQLIAKHSGKPIGAEGGASATGNGVKFVQQTDNGGKHQLFKLKPLPSLVEGRKYRIISKTKLKPIEIREGNDDQEAGVPLQLWDHKPIDNQIFQLNKFENGYWGFTVLHSGLSIALHSNGAYWDGEWIVQRNLSDNESFQFKINHHGAGWYYIQNHYSTKVWSVHDGGLENGEVVVQRGYKYLDSQLFYFEEV